jgi:hypothetical protein
MVFEKGIIAEKGTYEELIAMKGKFFKQSKRLDELFFLPCHREISITNSARKGRNELTFAFCR